MGRRNVSCPIYRWFHSLFVSTHHTVAEEQYHGIISAADAWLVTDDEGDGEGTDDRELKSTNSARRIKVLVEQITGRLFYLPLFACRKAVFINTIIYIADRYSPLPHFTQRTRFLITVQLPLLEHYHGRISSSLDAFETFSSAFVRAVPGGLGVSLGGKEEGGVKVDTRTLTSGVEGVQRLCKALLSAKYIEVTMEGWGEDLVSLSIPFERRWNNQSTLSVLSSSSSNCGRKLTTEHPYAPTLRRTHHYQIPSQMKQIHRRTRFLRNLSSSTGN